MGGPPVIAQHPAKAFRVPIPGGGLDLSARPLLMGILNVTPDSFSDGAAYRSVEEAVARGLEMEAEGAAILDVGGESTRPGSLPVPADEEMRRVIPVIRGLVAKTLLEKEVVDGAEILRIIHDGNSPLGPADAPAPAGAPA